MRVLLILGVVVLFTLAFADNVKNTNGKIVKMLDCADQDMIFTLMNSIHFKGKCKNENLAQEGDFHVNEKTTVKMPFVTTTGIYNVAFTNDATVVSIPYKGDVEAMFILPKEGKFSEVEQNINEKSILKWKLSMHKQLVELSFPKSFVSGSINLKETSSKLCTINVFPGNTGVSGITGEANKRISKTVCKDELNGDELEIKAADSTVPLTPPPRVTFDQPSFFLSLESTLNRYFKQLLNPQE